MQTPRVGQTPPRIGQTPLDADLPPPDTVNKRVVRILLEWILVNENVEGFIENIINITSRVGQGLANLVRVISGIYPKTTKDDDIHKTDILSSSANSHGIFVK